MTAFAPPTQDVAGLVELIGPEAALALMEARGGTRLYVSEAVAGRTITDIIGIDAAGKLASEYGRDRIKVPLGRVWRILCYRAQGQSYREIALRVGCGEGMVWSVLSRHGGTQKQYDLFDRPA